ncbi:MAG: ATP-binding protein, partial [Daejeonella sp.]|uniref:ATP-binding protein n=1 Tax=Daejeonella sp. TaxID=2805397 RepID=UPI003C727994
ALADVGRPLADVKENFRFPAIIDNIQHVIDTGEILEKEIQTTDMRWYQMNIIPYLIVKENRNNGVIITFVEITMRIKDLKEQEKLIAEHEMLLDTISHDIKSPLTALNLTIQMLKKIPEKGMEKFPILLANVESSLVNMQQIINDLTRSRWQQHRYQAVEELINIEHIIEDVRMTLAPQIEESKTILKSKIGASEIVFVRRKLRSLLYNLVSNAIKYASPERRPEILIRTEVENGFMIISVIDNGEGIAPENYKTIFAKYHRLRDSVEGNGVGLFLVKEIVNSADGKISVESELGKGSKFKVFLKLEEAASSSIPDKRE